MESILLEVEPDLMDANEAAELLMQWGEISEQDVQDLEAELNKANQMESPCLPKRAAKTLAIIELVQMAPPTPLLQ